MSEGDVTLALEKRDIVGKHVKQLRRNGLVPAVIHDHGKPSIHVMAPYSDINKAYRLAGRHAAVHLTVGDRKYLAMIKAVDIEPKKYRLQHVVFNAVRRNEKVEAEVPIHVRYAGENEVSPAERSGFIVLTNLETVELSGTPSKLPDAVEYDGEKLVNVGDHVTVADLILPEGVEMLTDTDRTIATVYEPSAIAAANDAVGGEAEEAVKPEEPEEETAELSADEESSAEEAKS